MSSKLLYNHYWWDVRGLPVKAGRPGFPLALNPLKPLTRRTDGKGAIRVFRWQLPDFALNSRGVAGGIARTLSLHDGGKKRIHEQLLETVNTDRFRNLSVLIV